MVTGRSDREATTTERQSGGDDDDDEEEKEEVVPARKTDWGNVMGGRAGAQITWGVWVGGGMFAMEGVDVCTGSV